MNKNVKRVIVVVVVLFALAISFFVLEKKFGKRNKDKEQPTSNVSVEERVEEGTKQPKEENIKKDTENFNPKEVDVSTLSGSPRQVDGVVLSKNIKTLGDKQLILSVSLSIDDSDVGGRFEFYVSKPTFESIRTGQQVVVDYTVTDEGYLVIESVKEK